MSDQIKILSDASFDEHVKLAETPVLVDFWADWCGPCKMIAPVLEQIAGENVGKVQVAKLNIDENLDVTRRFEVMSIPTLILFKDGEPKIRITGARGKAQLLQEIAPFLT
jgi:thioredoxin 1